MSSVAGQAIAGTTESPFDNGHTDPWTKTFIDYPELNAGATNAVAAAIKDVSHAARRPGAELRAKSILLLGPAGAGKTHLFARLRRKLGPRAVFVHLRPLVGTEMTPRYVLGQIVRQLDAHETAEGGLKQLNALVGSSLAQLDGSPPEYPRSFLEEVTALDEGERQKKLAWALEQLLEHHPEADEAYLERLLATPFMARTQQRAAIAWLAGWDLEDAQMARLGVHASLADERIIDALKTLGMFAAPGAPIVLVFDQLENLLDAEGNGLRVRAYANLFAELFDTMRGIVLVQMALDTEWHRAILPLLSEAQKTRLSGHSALLALPTPAQRRELLRRWIAHLPVPEGTTGGEFPWPFGEARVARWCDAPGMTPRMLLLACRQALILGPDAPLEDDPPATERGNASPVDPASADDALGALWQEHLVSARYTLDQAAADRRAADPARIVGGMVCALRFVDGFAPSRVDARQSVPILARIGDAQHAVVVLHQTHPRAVASALDRAKETLEHHAVLVVRERAIEFPPTWKTALGAQDALVKKGARWMSMDRDETAWLLTLESFTAAAKSHDLEDDAGHVFEERVIDDWLRRVARVRHWPFVAAVAPARKENETDRRANEHDDAPAATPSNDTAASGKAAETEPPKAAPAARADTATTVRVCLQQLGVASLDRLVREVARLGPAVTRAEVEGVLVTMRDRVRWFGRSIVADEGEP